MIKPVFCLVFLLFLTHLYGQKNTDYTQYVDPFIGTAAGGNTFPAASYPFGMVKLGPDCGTSNNAGYNSEGEISGFSHVHLSGAGGSPKYGNILMYPFEGEVQIKGYGSNRKNEKANVGYFSVELSNSNIQAELTSTAKSGLHRYTFSSAGDCGILVDCGHILGTNWCCFESQELVGSEVKILSETEIAGYNRVRGGWNIGGAYTVYFYALFDTPASSFGTWKANEKHLTNKVEFDSGEPVGAWFKYENKDKKVIQVRVGISFISEEKAKQNCINEAGKLTFEEAVEKAKEEWNGYLSRISVESTNEVEKTKFYTALYHTMLQPTDRTGENPLWTNNIPYYDDFFAIWDTYRTNGPLMSLIAPGREAQIVNSLIDMYEHEGYMPDARSGNSTGRTQGGSNCDMLVAEAILKGLKGVDYERAWKAMVKNAEVDPGGDSRKYGRGGLNDYKALGYVSTNFERAGTRTVEYAANDWAIALCALKLGKTNDYKKYYKRAGNWENLWKPIESFGATGFIMPRKANGDWDEDYREPTIDYFTGNVVPPQEIGVVTPANNVPEEYLEKKKFTPHTDGTWVNFFYESTSWEYSLYVPQDVSRLIAKSGGTDQFISRLDTFFTKGYFNIANEPGFFAPYLYIYAGRYDKSVKLLDGLLGKYYTDKTDGIPGNDDSGAMSSWYVFNKIGVFPNAGQDVYLITTPHFNKISLKVSDSRIFTIKAENLSSKNIYIESAELNGETLNQPWLRHSDIKKGGILVLKMTDKPGIWGTENLPPSRSKFSEIENSYFK